ncbi:PhzF family phenazine biosynthesis protein [Leeia sp. TBRC 13508]|uniref:PhzF family phenazine biosynthesis protein n=1 Tax=Leeia speluncae TaxID=2884804 RepID=A0ABS8D5Z3_9NEIS|nr:PhzF family phenazine biosynthesis protein [Leeia speluncae]MCB6183587.1 PhzF family phenazine biosynthesis protein [Leeia speluncae]
MRDATFYTYDVFTSEYFGGNPLAIFPCGEWIDDRQKQKIAREFNLSETVFIEPSDLVDVSYKLRIFTPAKELPFAGHPTIGAAIHLARSGLFGDISHGEVRALEVKAGVINVSFEVSDGVISAAKLVAPQPPRFFDDVPEVSFLEKLTGLSSEEIRLNDFRPQYVTCGTDYLLIPVRDLQALKRFWMSGAYYPQAIELAREVGVDLNGLFAFSKVEDKWQARMLWNDMGIAEDPATGSAAVCLAAYLASREQGTSGIFEWSLSQGVEMGRPSSLIIGAQKEDGVVRACSVAGSAVKVSKGEYLCL